MSVVEQVIRVKINDEAPVGGREGGVACRRRTTVGLFDDPQARIVDRSKPVD
jgi:hypothetical protein